MTGISTSRRRLWPEFISATITKWNDPEIAKANPGVNLPSDDIVVVHRSDGSGTTYIWTDFLSKVSDEWKTKVGKAHIGELACRPGRQGQRRRLRLVKQTPDSIGYVELIYASRTTFLRQRSECRRKIRQGRSGQRHRRGCRRGQDMPDDFRVSITNAPGEAYPISSFTWLLIPAQIQDATKRDAIKDFLNGC